MNYIGWLENTAEGSIEHTRTTKLANEDCCFEKKKKTNQVPKQEKLAWVVGYKALLIEKRMVIGDTERKKIIWQRQLVLRVIGEIVQHLSTQLY